MSSKLRPAAPRTLTLCSPFLSRQGAAGAGAGPGAGAQAGSDEEDEQRTLTVQASRGMYLRSTFDVLYATFSAATRVPDQVDPPTSQFITLVMPCLRPHNTALAIVLYTGISEGIACLVEHQSRWRQALLCLLDGPAAKNFVTLVEIAIEVAKCMLRILLGQEQQQLQPPLQQQPQPPLQQHPQPPPMQPPQWQVPMGHGQEQAQEAYADERLWSCPRALLITHSLARGVSGILARNAQQVCAAVNRDMYNPYNKH
ncbi:Carbon catabolite repressor protein 4-like protein 6 [Frankliniella fusca]|uniref:Carbon catabolite repressor protein 4-like protein 6 n=1 Tax=Frankliniella fusca TaxID=407009 RepID=A0AAE1GZ01_9NEOP|nr:Carbon catabolite repressor protein 4-like protein 6 [Frankliniella fusca]